MIPYWYIFIFFFVLIGGTILNKLYEEVVTVSDVLKMILFASFPVVNIVFSVVISVCLFDLIFSENHREYLKYILEKEIL